MSDVWPWAVLALLGAFHGINPAMGWLFAVALGLQAHDRGAVLWALVPIALGHAAAITVVVAAVAAARVWVDPRPLRLAAAGVLVAVGAWRLWRGMRHRGRAGMQVGFWGLAFWSFLAATAHGAGLMVVPALLHLQAGSSAAAAHVHRMPGGVVAASAGQALAAVAVHTAAMLAVAGGVALVVFDRVGLGILRKAWVNLDLIWALALLAAGAVMLVL